MNTQLNPHALDFGAIVGKKPTGTRFILVRHGETDWNREKRFQGHIDIALNSHGLAQAGLVQQYFQRLEAAGLVIYQHCVSSDLERAYTTARVIHRGKAQAIELDAGLRERHYGHLSGLTADEMQAKSPTEYQGLRERTPEASLLGGESIAMFYKRVVATFNRIALAHEGQHILLVAHGGVLDCIYRHCTDEPLDKQRTWALPNCALNVIELDSQANWSVPLWAWSGHLGLDRTGQNMDEVDGRIA